MRENTTASTRDHPAWLVVLSACPASGKTAPLRIQSMIVMISSELSGSVIGKLLGESRRDCLPDFLALDATRVSEILCVVCTRLHHLAQHGFDSWAAFALSTGTRWH